MPEIQDIEHFERTFFLKTLKLIDTIEYFRIIKPVNHADQFSIFAFS